MSQRSFLCLFGLLLIGGCASYETTKTPVVTANDSDLVFNEAGYGAKVDPYAELDRQKAYFNADFNKAGFLAVNVIVKNNGKAPIDVRPYDIYVVLPAGGELAPVDGRVVAMGVEEGGSVVGSAIAFGVIGGLVAMQSQTDAKNARVADYASKQLREGTLAPGDSTHGFVFYQWKPDSSPPAEFQIRLYDKATSQRSVVKVAFESSKVSTVSHNPPLSQEPASAVPMH